MSEQSAVISSGRLRRIRLRIRSAQVAVIMMISVLSTLGVIALLLSMLPQPGVSSAIANHIISNMRNIKSSFVEWYADNSRKTDDTAKLIADFISDKAYYFEDRYSLIIVSDRDNAMDGDYMLTVLDDGKSIYTSYKFNSNENNSEVKTKLTRRAASTGLLNSDGRTPYNNGSEAYMLILNLSEDKS